MTLTSSPNAISYKEIAKEGNLIRVVTRLVVISTGSCYFGYNQSEIQAQIDTTVSTIQSRMPEAKIFLIIPVANMYDFYKNNGSTTTLPATAATNVANKYGLTKIIFKTTDNIHPSSYPDVVAQILPLTTSQPSEWYVVGDSNAYGVALAAGAVTNYSLSTQFVPDSRVPYGVTPKYIIDTFVPLLPQSVELNRLPPTRFGKSPENNQWAHLLAQLEDYPISFDNLHNKQNIYTLYDNSKFYFAGRDGMGEKDTVTPGVPINLLYPNMFKDYAGIRGGGYGNLWFSVDVAAPSTLGSVPSRPAWNVPSPGNYNGSYEVWRCFFPFNPDNPDTAIQKTDNMVTQYREALGNGSGDRIANYKGGPLFDGIDGKLVVNGSGVIKIPIENNSWDNSAVPYVKVGFVSKVDNVGFERIDDLGEGPENTSPGIYRTNTSTGAPPATTAASTSTQDPYDYIKAMKDVFPITYNQSATTIFGTTNITQEQMKAQLALSFDYYKGFGDNRLSYWFGADPGSNPGQLYAYSKLIISGAVAPKPPITIPIRADAYLDYQFAAADIVNKFGFGFLDRDGRAKANKILSIANDDWRARFASTYTNSDAIDFRMSGWRIDSTNNARLTNGTNFVDIPLLDYRSTLKKIRLNQAPYDAYTFIGIPDTAADVAKFDALSQEACKQLLLSSSGQAQWTICFAGVSNISDITQVCRPVNRGVIGYAPIQTGITSSATSAQDIPSTSRTVKTAYYSFRPNFTRDVNGNAAGNRVNVYYNYTDGVVYASSYYNGSSPSTNKGKVYLLNVQWWPPHSKNATDDFVSGTCRGLKDPVDTNNFHILCMGTMGRYLITNPPINISTTMPSLETLSSKAVTINTSTTAGLIATTGDPVYRNDLTG